MDSHRITVEGTAVRPENPSTLVQVTVSVSPATKGIYVASHLRSGIRTEFSNGNWSKSTQLNGGSEGLVLINTVDSDKRIGSITACEDMAFSGCFMGRRTLGIKSLNAELFRVSGTITSALDYEGFAFAAAAAVVTALSPNTVPQEALMPLDWRVTTQVVLAG